MGLRKALHVPSDTFLPAKRPEGSGKRRAETAPAVPTEDQEQRVVAAWLDAHGVLWAHVPNGGARDRITGAILKGLGVKRGCPDILIFDPPPIGGYVGTAIELKRREGGRVSPEQRFWLAQFADRHWYALACYGADDAIDVLQRLGYGRRDARCNNSI